MVYPGVCHCVVCHHIHCPSAINTSQRNNPCHIYSFLPPKLSCGVVVQHPSVVPSASLLPPPPPPPRLPAAASAHGGKAAADSHWQQQSALATRQGLFFCLVRRLARHIDDDERHGAPIIQNRPDGRRCRIRRHLHYCMREMWQMWYRMRSNAFTCKKFRYMQYHMRYHMR